MTKIFCCGIFKKEISAWKDGGKSRNRLLLLLQVLQLHCLKILAFKTFRQGSCSGWRRRNLSWSV